MADTSNGHFSLFKVLFCAIISQKVNPKVRHINMLCDEAFHLNPLFADFCRHGSIAQQRYVGAVSCRNFLIGRQNTAALYHTGRNQTGLTSSVQKTASGCAVKSDPDIDLLLAKVAFGCSYLDRLPGPVCSSVGIQSTAARRTKSLYVPRRIAVITDKWRVSGEVPPLRRWRSIRRRGKAETRRLLRSR